VIADVTSVVAISGCERTVWAVERSPDLFEGGADLTRRLADFAADARADVAASARAREGFLRRTAPEEATFAGVLVDLAERGSPVLVVGANGRRHRGVLRTVGRDFAGLRTPDGRDVLLAHHGIASVRPDGRAPEAAGDRSVSSPLGLAEALAVLAEDRPRVLVVTVPGDEGLAGTLGSVGRDVVAVLLDGADRRTAYVAVAAIAEVTLA
jgi:hypothetical protein